MKCRISTMYCDAESRNVPLHPGMATKGFRCHSHLADDVQNRDEADEAEAHDDDDRLQHEKGIHMSAHGTLRHRRDNVVARPRCHARLPQPVLQCERSGSIHASAHLAMPLTGEIFSPGESSV